MKNKLTKKHLFLTILLMFSLIVLFGCSTDPKLVKYRLPERPPSCTKKPAQLSKKDVKRDINIMEAVEWHINDRIAHAKERARWLDCQRFLKRTWRQMQSK